MSLKAANREPCCAAREGTLIQNANAVIGQWSPVFLTANLLCPYTYRSLAHVVVWLLLTEMEIESDQDISKPE